ncbi:MAG: formylglycine-generating enzyme family protein [Bacteroidales bacterium]|nr:formylglycine-generating enzyme family protein [Bacteroidales bacterium]
MKLNTKTFLLSAMVFFNLCFCACKNDDNDVSVKTYHVTNISSTSGTIHGTTTYSDAEIIDAGIVFTSASSSEVQSPKITNSPYASKTSGSFSDFTVVLIRLSSDSTYRFRAYAQTADTVYYGSIYSFVPTNINIPAVLVSGGTFTMGATAEQVADANLDENPTHAVTLNNFRIGTYEVTNAQFVKFLRSRCIPSSGYSITSDGTFRGIISTDYTKGIVYDGDTANWVVQPGFENIPVLHVSWFGACEFCQWAGGRLPTEAEWEYAARGGNSTPQFIYSGSNTASEVAWYEATSNGLKNAHVIGLKDANNLGLFDMSGNVWEWVYDWYDSYSSKAQINPTGLTDDQAEDADITKKVRRGGGWANNDDSALRVSTRGSNAPGIFSGSIGFRFAKDAQ